MAVNLNQVRELVFAAIDELNEQRDAPLPKDDDTVLFGRDAQLDSLGLVNLVVAIEEQVADAFDVSLSLADEDALAQESSPFHTVGTLTAYVCSRLEREGAGA